MKKIHFGEMLKQAWTWTKKNLRLWWLGLFIGLGGIVFNFRAEDIQDAFTQVFNDSGVDGLKNFLSSFGNVSILVLSLLFIFAALAIIGILANAGVILGIKKIKDNEKYKLRDLAKFGFKKIPRILLLEIILGIPYYVLLIPVVVYLVFLANKVLFILFVICLLALAVYTVFVALFKHYAYCYAILEEQTAWKAIVSGINLLKNNFWSFVAVKLIQIGLWIVVAIGISFAVGIAMLPVLLIGFLLSLFASGAAAIVIGVVGNIVGVLTFLIFRAGTNVFFQGYLTGVFWKAKE